MDSTEYRVTDAAELADVLKRERERQSLSQRDLAKRSKVSSQMISAIEGKKREPTIGVVGMLALALGVVIVLGELNKKK